MRVVVRVPAYWIPRGKKLGEEAWLLPHGDRPMDGSRMVGAASNGVVYPIRTPGD